MKLRPPPLLSQVGTGARWASPVALARAREYALRLDYDQDDSTGEHPAIALQWSLQGAAPLDDAVAAALRADATVLVLGGGTSVTSGDEAPSPAAGSKTKIQARRQSSEANRFLFCILSLTLSDRR